MDVRKNFLIFTVSLQLGKRNYRFISVTNRYGILILLVNVVENHKNYLPTFKRRKIGRVVPNWVGRVSRSTDSAVLSFK